MRAREVDIVFSDQTGVGRVFITDVLDEDLVRIAIDKQPRGQPFPGVVTHATLTEAQARKLRDALDVWLRRNDPVVEIVSEPPPR